MKTSGYTTSTLVDNTTGTASVTGANQTAAIAIAGHQGAGFLLANVGGTATFVVEASYDGGTTWDACSFFKVSTRIPLASVAAAGQFEITNFGGATNLRVRCSAYTSGTWVVTLNATAAKADGRGYEGADAGTPALSSLAIGGTDANAAAHRTAGCINQSPNFGFNGLITRAIPTSSGSQANAWSAATVAVNDPSTQATTAGCGTVCIFGTLSVEGFFTVQVSSDNSTWTDVFIIATDGSGNLFWTGKLGTNYVRLKAGTAGTATVTILGSEG